ncbi:MAG: hypothetical protein HRT47_03060 [Candidatus Caenarcaniphilales bacterium]|nr:hypothetical protein [Candidatus Caenarcaniphilales bacterium]
MVGIPKDPTQSANYNQKIDQVKAPSEPPNKKDNKYVADVNPDYQAVSLKTYKSLDHKELPSVTISSNYGDNTYQVKEYRQDNGRVFSTISKDGEKTEDVRDVFDIAPGGTDGLRPVAFLMDVSSSAYPAVAEILKEFPKKINELVIQINNLPETDYKQTVENLKAKLPRDNKDFLSDEGSPTFTVKLALVEALDSLAKTSQANVINDFEREAAATMATVLEDDNNYYLVSIGDTRIAVEETGGVNKEKSIINPENKTPFASFGNDKKGNYISISSDAKFEIPKNLKFITVPKSELTTDAKILLATDGAYADNSDDLSKVTDFNELSKLEENSILDSHRAVLMKLDNTKNELRLNEFDFSADKLEDHRDILLLLKDLQGLKFNVNNLDESMNNFFEKKDVMLNELKQAKYADVNLAKAIVKRDNDFVLMRDEDGMPESMIYDDYRNFISSLVEDMKSLLKDDTTVISFNAK